MLKVGDTITIRYSKRLAQSGNSMLANKVGTVTRLHRSNGMLLGAYVKIKVFKSYRDFYVPVISIEGPDDIDRMRNLLILKSTKL